MCYYKTGRTRTRGAGRCVHQLTQTNGVTFSPAPPSPGRRMYLIFKYDQGKSRRRGERNGIRPARRGGRTGEEITMTTMMTAATARCAAPVSGGKTACQPVGGGRDGWTTEATARQRRRRRRSRLAFPRIFAELTRFLRRRRHRGLVRVPHE